MAPNSYTNFRVRGIPATYRDKKHVRELVRRVLGLDPETRLTVYSLASNPIKQSTKIATMSFSSVPKCLCDEDRSKWKFEIQPDGANHEDNDEAVQEHLFFDTHFSGFTPLHSGQDLNRMVDFIAVTGLNGHALGSFKERAGAFIWLRDALPADCSTARIFTYGYDAQLQGSTSFQNVTDLGKQLLASIRAIRKNSNGRPIVLLGHSLGGLVIKEAILSADEFSFSDKDFIGSIKLVLFFGVPSQGMAIESLVPMVNDQPNRALLESLGRNSPILRRHEREFPLVFGPRVPDIVAFYETKMSPTAQKKNGNWELNGPPAVLVEVSSATYGSKSQHPVNSTHSDMVKFGEIEDPSYQSILSHMDDIDMSDAARKDPTKAEMQACLRSLAFKEQDARQYEILPEENTCEWLFQNSKYRSWLEATQGLVWIQGKPGAGKSTLMKFAMEKMQALRTTERELVVSYFIDGRGTVLQKTHLGLYRALLNKILREPESQKFLAQLTVKYVDRVERMGSHTENWEWSAQELKEVLESALQELPSTRPVILYVDGLDELGKDAAGNLATFFRALMSRIENINSEKENDEENEEMENDDIEDDKMENDEMEHDEMEDVEKKNRVRLKLCCSCRHYPILTFDHDSKISLEHENHHDIHTVVKNQLKEVEFSSASKRQIHGEIITKARGVFQWAILVSRKAVDLSLRGLNPHVIRKRIQELPPELNKLYGELLKEVNPYDKHQTVRLFQWICFAKRPLRVQELREAMAIESNMTTKSAKELQSSENYIKNREAIIRRTQDLSKGLVEFTKVGTGPIRGRPRIFERAAQFIHQSVSDYLIEHGFAAMGQRIPPSLSLQGSFEISRSCLKYLAIRELHQSLDKLSFTEAKLSLPLLSYAVEFLPEHLIDVDDAGYIQDDLLGLFSSAEIQDNGGKTTRSMCVYPQYAGLGFESNSAHFILRYGIFSVLRSVNHPNGIELNHKNKAGETPLCLALRHQFVHTDAQLCRSAWRSGRKMDEIVSQQVEEILRRLIFLGVDINSDVKRGVSALEYAVIWEREWLVRVLLGLGADPNRKFALENPLLRAVQSHQLTIAQLLLDYGASTKAVYKFWVTQGRSGRAYAIVQRLFSLCVCGKHCNNDRNPNGCKELYLHPETGLFKLEVEDAFCVNERYRKTSLVNGSWMESSNS